jgi:hypothetical protein
MYSNNKYVIEFIDKKIKFLNGPMNPDALAFIY